MSTSTKARQREQAEACERLRDLIKPGDTVYTSVKHVSRSGMSRVIQCYIFRDNEPRWISYSVALATGHRFDRDREGVRIGGCGMDMGFALVYDLAQTLYGEGYQCLGDKCPSNYHTNYRRTVNCPGVGEGDARRTCWKPSGWHGDTTPETWKRNDAGRVLACLDDNGQEVCPTCQGAGELPNPEGPERFDLTHTDGYCLKQRWL